MLSEIFLSATSNIQAREKDQICLDNLDDFLKSQLTEATNQKSPDPAWGEGRLGPEEVKIDVKKGCGTNVITSDRLGTTSHSNFSTVLGNVCVYKGRWQYEVLLGSKGVMQFGWCTVECKFTQQAGVGDTVNSYAYDGNRVLKWNNETSRQYGDLWMTGDIVTCTIDCDVGEIAFYRNGKSLGIAYNNIKLGPGMAYFPGCSLSPTENVKMNYGATPLRYPVDGYRPLQRPPTESLVKAELLSTYLEKLVMTQTNTQMAPLELQLKQMSLSTDQPMVGVSTSLKSKATTTDKSSIPSITDKTKLLLVGSHIFEYLGPLLRDHYVVEECLMPLILKLCDVKKWEEPQRGVDCLLDLLTGLLQEHEFVPFMDHLVVSMMRRYRFTPVCDGYQLQKRYLVAVLALLSHPSTRLHLVKHVLFENGKFPFLIHIRPPEEALLEEMVPTVWWPQLKENKKDAAKEPEALPPAEQQCKDAYFTSCDNLRQQVQQLEDIQYHIIRLLLSTEGDCTGSGVVTTRFVFLHKLRRFFHDYMFKLEVCEFPWPVGLCLFHRLVKVVRDLWDEQAEKCSDGSIPHSSGAFVSPKKFYDNSINYYEVKRLGGLISHLLKQHKVVLQQEKLKAAEIDANKPIHKVILEDNHKLVSSGCQVYKDQLGAEEGTESLQELIDGFMWLYTISAHKQLVKLATIRDTIDEVKRTLNDINKKLSVCPSHLTSIKEELQNSKSVLINLIDKQSRQMSWLHAVVMTQEKRDDVYWLLGVILRSLEKSYDIGPLSVFVPEFYISTVIQTYQAIRNYFHPTLPTTTLPDYEKILQKYAVFLSNHFCDDRIVNVDCKRVVTEILASFVSYPDSLRALENMHELNRMNITKTLLLPYDDRSWAQSNWILSRIWKGNGYAFRYHVAPHLSGTNIATMELFDGINQEPCPSTLYQGHISHYLHHNPDKATRFVDSLLNQLNWSFSEFTGMLKELHSIANRTESALIDGRQLKVCAACFDVAVNLLRVVELVVALVPELFLDFSRPSAELLLCRLCQSLSQILNRVTSKSHTFDIIVKSHIPGMEIIDHFPILAALTGALVKLIGNTEDQWKQRATSALLAEPSFQPTCLDFLVADTSKRTESGSVESAVVDTCNVPEGETLGASFHTGGASVETAQTVGSSVETAHTEGASVDAAHTGGASVETGNESLQEEHNIFSLRNFEEVSTDEITQLVNLISHLKQHKLTMRSISLELDEDTVCKICYANPQAVVFKPCGHMSCRACIAQHMMHNKACFFCTAKVENVEQLDEGTPV